MLGDLFMSALEMVACPFEEYSQQGIAYQIFGLSSHHGIDKFKYNNMVSRSFRLINDVSMIVTLKGISLEMVKFTCAHLANDTLPPIECSAFSPD